MGVCCCSFKTIAEGCFTFRISVCFSVRLHLRLIFLLTSLFIPSYALSEQEGTIISSGGQAPGDLDLYNAWKASVFSFPTTLAYAYVVSDHSIDPNPSTGFTVFVVFRFLEIPPYRSRQNLLAKFSDSRSQNLGTGWAISVERYDTGMRPRVYFVDNNGSGGWYTFDRFEFIPRRWYSIMFTYTPRKDILLFVEELPILDDLRSSKKTVNSGNLLYGKLRFAGGYNLAKILVPKTDANLFIGTKSFNWKNAFVGEILAAIISQRYVFEDPEKWRQQIDNARVLPKLFGNDSKLWNVLASWSPAEVKKNISMRGDARWKVAR